jgi:hypothetical protein
MTLTSKVPQYIDPDTQCRVLAYFRYPDPVLGETRETVLGETITLPLSLVKELENIGRVELLQQ